MLLWVNAIWELALLSGIGDKCLVWWFVASLDKICDHTYTFKPIWIASTILGRLYSLRYCFSFRQLYFPHFSRPYVVRIVQVFFEEKLSYLLGLHVHQTCHPSNMPGIWLVVNLLSWSFSNHSQSSMNSHTNYEEGDSPGTFFDAMPCYVEALTVAHGGLTLYLNLMVTNHVLFCNSNYLSIVIYLNPLGRELNAQLVI